MSAEGDVGCIRFLPAAGGIDVLLQPAREFGVEDIACFLECAFW